MVAAEAAACGSPPLVARHSGLAEIAAGLEEEYPAEHRDLASFEHRRRARPRARSCARSSRSAPDERAGSRSAARARRREPLELGAHRRRQYFRFDTFAPHGRGAAPDPGRAAAPRPGALRGGGRLHGRRRGGVRAPRPRDARPRQPLRGAPGGARRARSSTGSLVGELIASEVEIRTGRCDTFAEAAGRMGERRAQLLGLADGLGIALASTGTHPWSPWQEQRIIDTPHYRRNDEILRYVVWRNNSFGLHVHTAIRGADRAVRVTSALRNVPARAARALGQLAVRRERASRASTRRARRSSRSCSRAAASRTRSRAGPRTSATCAGSTRRARSPSTRRSGGASGRTSPSRRSRSGSATASRSSPRRTALAALLYALTARIARALDEGEPLPHYPHHLLEENFWRAIRYGLVRRADRPRRVPRAAGAPGARGARGARRVGAARSPRSSASASYLADPGGEPRRSARSRATRPAATLREIYADEVLEPARV